MLQRRGIKKVDKNERYCRDCRYRNNHDKYLAVDLVYLVSFFGILSFEYGADCDVNKHEAFEQSEEAESKPVIRKSLRDAVSRRKHLIIPYNAARV